MIINFINRVIALLLMYIRYVSVQESPWCDLDSGPTTITDHFNQHHSVYVSATQDGARWIRVGMEKKSDDWNFKSEYSQKYQIEIFSTETMNLLKSLNYTQYCVLSDLEISIRMKSSWQPSYVSVYRPDNQRLKVLFFPNQRDCAMDTNLTLSQNRQEFLCNGGRTNSCGFKGVPEMGQRTGTHFIKKVFFDPNGNGNWMCTEELGTKSYTFLGSYYYAYLKMAQCSLPYTTRVLGYDAKQRNMLDTMNNVIIIPDPTQQILSTTRLKGWQVYTQVTSIQHQIFLQIWRPVRQVVDQYILISETLFKAHKLRFNRIIVSNDVVIETGDVIGLYIPQKSGIPYSFVPCASQNQFVKVLSNPLSPPKVNQPQMFKIITNTQHLCRHYSVNVLLEHPEKTKRVETWKCPHSSQLDSPLPHSSIWPDGATNFDQSNPKPRILMDGHRTSLLAIHVIVGIIASLALLLTLVAIIAYYKAAHR